MCRRVNALIKRFTERNWDDGIRRFCFSANRSEIAVILSLERAASPVKS